ncbi:MAG: YcxB family protein [Porcipelethomonas sp.]
MTKFEINYKKTDICSFFNDTSKSRLLKSLALIYTVIGLTIFFIFLVASYFINGELNLAKPLPFIFLGVLIVLVVIAVTRTLKNAPEKMYKEFQSLYDGGAIICTFTDDRVYIESGSKSEDDGFILYSALERAIETDNYFYIFINSSAAQIIRKSALVEGSVDEVRENLKAALGSRYEDITKYRRSR